VRRDRIVSTTIVVLPLVAAALWTRHADAVKEASEATAWLTSDALREWNFGTLDQRLDPAVWTTIARRVSGTLLGLFLFVVPLAIYGFVRSSQRGFWLGILGAAVLPPLVFTNLYNVHDYYLAAVTPAVAAIVGLAADSVGQLIGPRRRLVVPAVALGVLAVGGSIQLRSDYWRVAYADMSGNGALLLARELDARTVPSELVGVVGLDWSPEVLYYARRSGLMVPVRNQEVAYDLMYRHGYRFLLASSPATSDLTRFARWRWIGALGPHTYALSATTAPPSSPFLATNDLRSAPRHASGARRIGWLCKRKLRLSPDRATWIVLEPPEPLARVSVAQSLAPLPARRVIFVAPAATRGERPSLSCSGTRALSIKAIVVGARRD
jgi:hypothetical protein